MSSVTGTISVSATLNLSLAPAAVSDLQHVYTHHIHHTHTLHFVPSPGIRGWFALHAPSSSSPSDEQTAQSSPPTSTTATYVGAVELSFSFANEGDRKLVVSHGLKMGWKAPKSCSIDLTFPQMQDRTQNEAMLSGNQRWRLEICISGVWLPLGTVAIPTAQQPTYKYCFLRYRFFEKGWLVS